MAVDDYNDYNESSWGSVFVPPYEDEYAPVSSGGVSQGGAQNIVGSIDQSTGGGQKSQQKNQWGSYGDTWETINPQYGPGGSKYRQGPYGAANDPVAGAWENGYDISLKKTGGQAPSAGSAAKPYASVGYSKTVYPTGATKPTFKAPEYEESEVKKRARKLAAPQRAELELKVKQALSQYYENPNVRKMILRSTLEGYGIGLARIMGQAEQTATQQYGAEHARLYNSALQEYNIAMQGYQMSGTQVKTQQPVYSKEQYDTLIKDIGVA